MHRAMTIRDPDNALPPGKSQVLQGIAGGSEQLFRLLV